MAVLSSFVTVYIKIACWCTGLYCNLRLFVKLSCAILCVSMIEPRCALMVMAYSLSKLHAPFASLLLTAIKCAPAARPEILTEKERPGRLVAGVIGTAVAWP